MYAYARTRTALLPTKLRIRPIEVGPLAGRLEAVAAVVRADDARRGQERHEVRLHADGAGARAAAAVRAC